MDQVFIRDLVAPGIIGVNDWEREKPQKIPINIVGLKQDKETSREFR